MIVLLLVLAGCAEEKRKKAPAVKPKSSKKTDTERKPAADGKAPAAAKRRPAKDRPVVAAKKPVAAPKKKIAAPNKEPKVPQKKKIDARKKAVVPPKPIAPDPLVLQAQADAEKAKFRKVRRSGVRPMAAVFLASGTVIGVVVILAAFQKAFRRQPDRLPNALQN